MDEVLSKDIKPEDVTRPSTLDDEGLLLTLKGWFQADSDHSRVWRSDAKTNFDFVAGDQWSPEDRQTLLGQKRPVITFNRLLTFIKAVAGMEINGRHEISFVPRNTGDTAVNELLTSASKWMADETDGEDEESDAFQKALICGMGFLEHRLDFEQDPAGLYVEESLDPLEMYWDCTAKKNNLSDARRIFRIRKMPLGDAQQLFPEFSAYDLDAKWVDVGPVEPQKTLEEKRVRDENVNYAEKKTVTIVHAQWYERETYHILADPLTGQKIELSDAKFKTLNKRLGKLGMPAAMLESVKLKKKCFKQAFLGSKVLLCEPAPVPDRFSWTCITGESHHNKRTWFGIVTPLRDPSMWANKWLSQGLHILNSTAKGGIFAEAGAFEDQRQAEQNYARPDGIVWVARGALSTQSGPKVMPKPGSGMPQGYIDLMQFAVDSLRIVSGVNLELLGQKDVTQPGVVEAQRKQAGMTVLATIFDSLRRTRKEIGKIRLYFIQNFLSDGRLIRVIAPGSTAAIPLVREKTLGEYSIIVNDTPTSPNQKEANWAIILTILPAFRDQLMQRPDILALLLEYSPLPERVVEAIKGALASPPPPDPIVEQLKQLEIAGKVAQITKDQSTAEMQDAKAGATQSTAIYDEAMAQHLLLKEAGGMGLEQLKAALELQQKAAETRTEIAKADQIAAQAHGARVGAHATAAGALIDALTPIPHSHPISGGPMEPPQPVRPERKTNGQ